MDLKTFFNKNFFNLFLFMKDKSYINILAKKTNLSICATSKLIQELEKNNLIETQKIGRRKIILYTEKVKRIQGLLIMLRNELK